MGSVIDGIGNAVSGAINTVEDVGKAAVDGLSGNIGGAVSDLGNAGSSLVNTAVNGFMATNPELGAIGDIGNMLGGILGQAGGFNPGAAGGSALPFGLGNILPGILQNPLQSIFGGAGGAGGGGLPGLTGLPPIGTGGAAGGAGGAGGAGAAGGAGGVGGASQGVSSQMQQLQQLYSYEESQDLAIQEMQMAHDLRKKAIDAINS